MNLVEFGSKYKVISEKEYDTKQPKTQKKYFPLYTMNHQIRGYVTKHKKPIYVHLSPYKIYDEDDNDCCYALIKAYVSLPRIVDMYGNDTTLLETYLRHHKLINDDSNGNIYCKMWKVCKYITTFVSPTLLSQISIQIRFQDIIKNVIETYIIALIIATFIIA